MQYKHLSKTIHSLFLLLLMLIISISASHAEQHKHHRMGSHGMVLFTANNNLYASHMPLYSKPHDYQLIFQVNTDNNEKLITYLNKHSSLTATKAPTAMLTILPDSFDLNKLINQQPLAIRATVFTGHFERNGKKWLENIRFSFDKAIYKKQIDIYQETQDSSNRKSQWAKLSLGKNDRHLFVHTINQKPSFDGIVLGNQCDVDKNDQVENLHSTIQKSTLTLVTHCKSQQVLYYETQDFQG